MPIVVAVLGIVYVLVNVSLIAIVIYRILRAVGFYSWWNDILGGVGTVVAVGLTIPILVVTVWAALFVVLFLWPLWLVAVFVFAEVYRRYRTSRQHALLWMLTVSVEQDVPLTTALEAFASERRGPMARRVRRLAEMLASGVALPDALEKIPGLLPSQSMPLIRVGCKSGDLATALRQTVADQDLFEPAWLSIIGKTTYLVVLLAVEGFLLLFVLLKILPSYEKIFRDFAIDLPPITQWMFACAHSWCDPEWLLLPSLFIATLVTLLIAKYFGLNVIGLRWMTLRLDIANTLDGLAIVARRQMPMLDGLGELAMSSPKSHIREKLRETAKDVQEGRDWTEAMFACGLLRRPELAVLRSAERAGNLAWALREMAASNRRRFIYKAQSFLQTAFPAAIILIGATVGIFVVALFVPLISLIHSLS